MKKNLKKNENTFEIEYSRVVTFCRYSIKNYLNIPNEKCLKAKI